MWEVLRWLCKGCNWPFFLFSSMQQDSAYMTGLRFSHLCHHLQHTQCGGAMEKLLQVQVSLTNFALWLKLTFSYYSLCGSHAYIVTVLCQLKLHFYVSNFSSHCGSKYIDLVSLLIVLYQPPSCILYTHRRIIQFSSLPLPSLSSLLPFSLGSRRWGKREVGFRARNWHSLVHNRASSMHSCENWHCW